MRTRPILFSGDMVRAILEGRKTQTRRVIREQPHMMALPGGKYPPSDPFVGTDGIWRMMRGKVSYDADDLGRCPFGVPGDRLWLRETWQYADWTEDGEPFIRYRADEAVRLCDPPEDEAVRIIEEIWPVLSEPENYQIDNRAADRKWRPSIYMPRWASRILFEVTDVRVEIVQDITESDAIAEGARFAFSFPGWDGVTSKPKARWGFHELWDSINAKRGYSWESNPWVWVVSFKRVLP